MRAIIAVRPAISTRLAVMALLACSCSACPQRQARPKRISRTIPPNIVVFYIDNASPHDGSLWNDPTRTPNISAALTTLGAATPREGRKTRLLTSF